MVLRKDLQIYLDLALNKENYSIELYKDLLESYKKLGEKNKKVKYLLLFLIKEENKHKKLIEKTTRELKSSKKTLKLR